jgi:thioredoxin-dependent peroxiredoxin
VVGASFDTVEENRHFAEGFQFPFPLLSDTDRKLGMAYGACDSPTEQYAKRIAYLIAPDGSIEHVWPKADPSTHAQEVLDLVPA